MADDQAAQATWLYAITLGLSEDALDGLDAVAGVSGAPVSTVTAAGLTAVVSPVDAAAVNEEALERSLHDSGRLEAMVRAHHKVIEMVSAASPALPLRLATVYHGHDRVRQLLAGRQAEFSKTLRWLNGRVECGVKVWADPEVLSAAEPAWACGEPKADDHEAASPTGPQPGPGTAYLLRRRASRTARTDAWQQAVTRGAEIHAAVGPLAAAAHRHPLQDQRLAPDDGVMVLNGAYLVDSGRVAEFAAAAEALVGGLDGFRLAVTGPWPPYSFAGGEES